MAGELMGDADLLNPHPEITALFCYYNSLYFQGKLGACSVKWSSPRMTLCAGICKYSYCAGCEIRLSEPLLKYRSVADLKNTLLHEMIHAFLFLTDGNKDHDDHGQYFVSKMKEINDSQVPDYERPLEGYQITVYHNFRDEVDNYRVHHWKCQSCGNMIKRAMNRPPSAADCVARMSSGSCDHPRCHWHMHAKTCGGSYLKVAEPAGYKDRRKTKATTTGVQKQNGDISKAAGKRKINENVPKNSEESDKRSLNDSSLDKFFGKGRKLVDELHSQDTSKKVDVIDLCADEPASRVDCPVCKKSFVGDVSKPEFNMEINQHLDTCLNSSVI